MVLNGKLALITGAAKRVGRSIALALGRAGADVIVHYNRSQDDARATAEAIRKWFLPLEDLRNEINPIRVLHHAVDLAGIAETGPMQPMLSELSSEHLQRIKAAVAKLGYGGV